jgi:hypothetical protein
LTAQVNPAGSNDGPYRRSELAQAVEALYRIAAAAVGSQATSGIVTDRNNLPTASWIYTPTAAS